MNPRQRFARAVRDVPIGLQLALVYTLLLAAILLALGVLLSSQLDRFFIENAFGRLQTQAQQVVTREARGPGGPGGRDRPGPGPSYLDRVSRGLVSELNARDTHVSIYGPAGTLLEEGKTYTGVAEWPPPTEAALQGALGGSPQPSVIPYGSTRAVRLILPVIEGGQPVAAAVLTTSLKDADNLLQTFRWYLIVAITGAGVIGTLIGIPLTRYLLRPLERVATTAEAISAGDLSRRVGLPPGRNELRRLGAAFDHMVDRIEATLQAQRQFIADSSHELRTPLTALGGMVEMLLLGVDAGDPRKTQRILSALDREIGRLSRLVGDLLTLSQLDAHPQLVRRPVSLSELVEEVADQARALSSGQEVARTVAPGLVVLGDADRLRQVVLNLVDNGFKYTPAGGRVSIDLKAHNGWAELRVEDTGDGIAPDALPHIFDRFYRVDKARARQSGGAGLGLAIAKSIAERHGGRIEATSDGPGQGSRFTLRLPLAAAGRPDPPDATQSDSPQPTLSSRRA